MACFRPLDVYPAAPPAKGIVFSAHKSYAGARSFRVPCGQCMGCRVARSQDWATRIAHESQLHEANSFLTLTYDDAHLPDDYSVHVREMQLFMKRLRKAITARIRFFACGEYGDAGGRPHYHAIIFGYDFPDKMPWRRTPTGFVTHRSALLERVWPYGHAEIGTVTHQSAGYVARYVIKKVGGEMAADHYRRINPLTGQLVQVQPEFICMSGKPGIGAGWYEKYASDAFPSDFVVIDGAKKPVPRYYKKKLAEREALAVTAKRKEKAREHADNNTDPRLVVREEVLNIKVDRLKRDMEQS